MEETLSFERGGGSLLSRFKSTLSSLPMYFTSFFSMPVHISHRLDNLQRDFLKGMRDEISLS